MRLLALLTAGLFAGAVMAEDKKEEKIDPAKLVGKWKATKWPDANLKDVPVIIEFTKGGEMTLKAGEGKAVFEMSGPYTVNGSTITVKFKGRDKFTDTMDIIKLTDGVLHLKNNSSDKKEVGELERVKDEKKDEKKDK